MDEKPLKINGREYISAKRASDITGYANDYVGQLCRLGKIKCEREWGNWLVDKEEIILYKEQKNGKEEIKETKEDIRKTEISGKRESGTLGFSPYEDKKNSYFQKLIPLMLIGAFVLALAFYLYPGNFKKYGNKVKDSAKAAADFYAYNIDIPASREFLKYADKVGDTIADISFTGARATEKFFEKDFSNLALNLDFDLGLEKINPRDYIKNFSAGVFSSIENNFIKDGLMASVINTIKISVDFVINSVTGFSDNIEDLAFEEFSKQYQSVEVNIQNNTGIAQSGTATSTIADGGSGLSITSNQAQTIVERVVERIMSGISKSDLDAEISQLNSQLLNQISDLRAEMNRQSSANFRAIALTNRINNLSTVTITSSTISSPTITSATISSPTISTPTITGALTVESITSSGQATFTNASSTLLTVSGTSYFLGNVGVGTSSPFTNLAVTGNGYLSGGLGIGVSTTTAGTLQTSGGIWAGGTLTTVGNAVIGDSASDILTINSIINSNLIPDANATRDIGSAAYYWDDVYVDNLVANNISAASTTISGTQSSTFTLNSDNATVDTESQDLIFYRGTIVPNALISWDAVGDRFDFNQPVFMQNDSSTTTVASLEVRGLAGQTADVLRIASSTGDYYLNVTSGGNVGIGTSSPYAKLSVSGETVSSHFTATSTTATSTFFGDLAVSGMTGNIITTTSVKSSIQELDTRLYNQQNNEKEPTGFPNRTDSSVSFTDATRTFTITGTNFKYYSAGKEYSTSTAAIQIPNSSGLYFIYYDKDTQSLTQSTTAWNLTDGTAQIATVYWSATSTKGLLGDERHGLIMDGMTHELLHNTVGTRYNSGLTGTFDNSSFSITTGTVYDEDINITIPATTTCRVFYRSGGGQFAFTSPQTKYFHEVSDVIQYDNNGTLTDVGANNYVAYWIFSTNDPANPAICLMGQNNSTTLNSARSANTYEGLSLGTLPFKEMKVLYRVIVRRNGTNETYTEAQDMRSVSNLPSGTYLATSHGILTGLTNDDHTQYALLAGRTGGQTLIGGADADNGLIIQANAGTSGNTAASTTVQFKVGDSGGTTAMAITNAGNVGIGTTSPYAKLSVVGEAVASYFTATSTTATSTFAWGVQANLLNITSTSATSTFANGINLAGGCFAVNGTCVGSSGGAGSGTTGQTAYYAADGTTLSATSTIFLSTASYVGIGTTLPSAQLEVVGDIVSVGTKWTSRSAATFNSIAYGNGTFVVVGASGAVRTSPDGINWTSRTAAQSNNWTSITYGNGLFVAVSSDGTNRVMTSVNGVTWTARASANDSIGWISVTYGNGLFVAVSNSAGTATAMSSSDGANWTIRTSINKIWQDVTFGNGRFVAVAFDSGAMYSTNGTSWSSGSAYTGQWASIVYGNGKFVAISRNASGVMTSTDGNTWTSVASPLVNNLFGISYGEGLFVVVGSGTTFYTSPDGSTWTARTISQSATWWKITYANGMFVAVSNSGNYVATSGKMKSNIFSPNNVYAGGMNVYGNVGLGTSSPYSQLSVWGSGTTTGSLLELTNSASTTLASFIDSGTGYFLGNIGIGTSSPYAKLSVVGETVTSYLTSTSTTATSSFAGGLTVGTSTPFNSGLFHVGGNGTSTFAANLHIYGALKAETTYAGDLIFANEFRFTEAPLDGTPQALILKNQNGEDIFTIDETGLAVFKDIVAETVTATKRVITDNFEMKDNATGETYCIRISNGDWEKIKGTCEVPQSASVIESVIPAEPAQEPAPVSEPVTEPVSEAPVESVPVSDSAPAPVVDQTPTIVPSEPVPAPTPAPEPPAPVETAAPAPPPEVVQ